MKRGKESLYRFVLSVRVGSLRGVSFDPMRFTIGIGQKIYCLVICRLLGSFIDIIDYHYKSLYDGGLVNLPK